MTAQYVKTLKRMVDCRTVFTREQKYREEYERFYRILEQEFPLLHERAERLRFGTGCFVYRIQGRSARRNVMLMSHHDVVEATEGWSTEPFCAVEHDGALWGRGTIDTKTPLFAELQIGYIQRKHLRCIDKRYHRAAVKEDTARIRIPSHQIH